MLAYRSECAARGKGSDVEFIDNRFFPWAPTPGKILPVENIRIDYFTRSMHVLRLKARGGVRNVLLIIDSELVFSPGASRIGYELKPTVLAAVKRKPHGAFRTIQAELYPTRSRSPKAKAHASIGTTLGAERHVMTALHSTLPSCRWFGAPSERPRSAPAVDRLLRSHRYRRDANHRLEMYPSKRSSVHLDDMPVMRILHPHDERSAGRGSSHPRVSGRVHRSRPVPGRRETFPGNEPMNRAIRLRSSHGRQD